MTITVHAPNGATVDFPDGMDEGAIHAVMQEHFGEEKAGSGKVANYGAGANEELATIIGAPVDVTNWALNKGRKAINAIAGTDLKPEEHPFGGSETIKRTMGLVGANPDDVVAATTGERLARAAGAGTAGMVIPGLGAEAALARAAGEAPTLGRATLEMLRGSGAVSNAAVGAGAGVGSEVAADAAPEAWKPLARMAGGLLGGGVWAVGWAWPGSRPVPGR